MLEHFDLTTAELLGQGGEAQVYALDADRVVRLYRGLAAPPGHPMARPRSLRERSFPRDARNRPRLDSARNRVCGHQR